MLEYTATPSSLKSRNRKSFNPLNLIQPIHENYDGGSRLVQKNTVQEISKGASMNHLKELSSRKLNQPQGLNQKEGVDRRVTWNGILTPNTITTNKRDNKSLDALNFSENNKENDVPSQPMFGKYLNNSFLQNINKDKGKARVTFKDDIKETEKQFANKHINQQKQREKQNAPSYAEQFKNYSKQLDRYQHSQQPQYENREVFHENIEKSYIENHNLSPEWNSDALKMAKNEIRKKQIITKALHIAMSISFVIAIIFLSSFFMTFKTAKLFKIIILISAVISLRTIVYEDQFQNGLNEQSPKDLAILLTVSIIEFFCLMGFTTEIFVVALPSNIQLEIFWIVPSAFLALMETVLYWRKSQSNKLNEEFLSIKCNKFDILLDSLKNYFQSFRFIKEALICAISSGIIVACCYLAKTYYLEQIQYTGNLSQKEYQFLYQSFPDVLLKDYFCYIMAVSILSRFIISFALNFSYQLSRFSVVEYLGNYICFQPLYSIIFKYPSAFSDFIQHEAMKYWYTYQTGPLSLVVQRTQYSMNLTENENKVLDSIFEFILKEMNNTLIQLTVTDMERREQSFKRDITSFFIKNRKVQSILRKQRFLQTILKYTLMTISNSVKVFNTRLVEFLQGSASQLDEMIHMFERQSNYYTAEIADIIILKKEIVSNLQYIFTKMNSFVKSQNLSALTYSILHDPSHIYNEYDLHSEFLF